MAVNNLRALRGRKAQQKAIEAPQVFVTEDQNALCLSLKPGLVQAGAVLELMPCAVALWSQDRSLCVLNDSSRQLLGFCEHDFRQQPSLWVDRIYPRDRDIFLGAWKKLQSGEKTISCHYRFLPKHQTQEIRLREVSFSYPIRESHTPGVWSLYTEDPKPEEEIDGMQQVRELVRGLTHEIGNSLQAISGELDLLRLAGALSQQSAKAMTHGVAQIRKVAHEIEEYLCPPPLELRAEDPGVVLTEVISDSEKELAEHGIRMTVVLRDSLPKVPLDWQFRSALKRVIEFSCALLPQGGELKIEAGLHRSGNHRYVELNLVNASPTYLSVEEKDVFRPFLKVNDCRVGLSMAMARLILRRHFGKIVFRKEQRNQGVFSILINVPSEPEV
jgi:signal transduction histidine kinase